MLKLALEAFLSGLVPPKADRSRLSFGPTTLERVGLQARIATVLFCLGAQDRGRACLANAARLADSAAWSPRDDEETTAWAPAIAAECVNWERIARCEGFENEELAVLADLLRRWGGAYIGGDDAAGVAYALAFWELGGRLHARRCPEGRPGRAY